MELARIEVVGRGISRDVPPGRSLGEAVKELGLRTVEYIPVVNGRVVTWDYVLRPGDEARLLPVVSGGAGCEVCGEEAVYNYLGISLCREHYIEYFEEKVLETIREHRLIRPGEHVAVAVSGGKDSLSLLYLLNKYRDLLGIELTALVIDEGIKGYRDLTIEDFMRINEDLGVKYRVISYEEVFGHGLDEIIMIARERGLPKYPCSYCGVFRRYLLNVGARIIGADVLATGHNLDDMVQTYLLNIVTNSLDRILHLLPRTSGADHPLLVPRVKPFYRSLEMETTLYSVLMGLYPSFIECVYAPEALRNDVRNYINELEERRPGIKYKIMNSLEELIEKLGPGTVRIGSCRICGEPTSGEVCRTCRYLDSLGLLENLLRWRSRLGIVEG